MGKTRDRMQQDLAMAGYAPGTLGGGVKGNQRCPRVREQCRARLGKGDTAGGALEQPHTELRLEPGDRARQGR